MRELSTEELRSLGEQFGIGVDPRQAERLRKAVNDVLETFDDIPGDSQTGHRGDIGVREWWSPSENPHNAVSLACSVPPTETATDLLAGYDVGLKDIVAVAGIPMECGSLVMDGFVPASDATVVRRLRQSGATITAKTNLDELALSGSGTTSATGPITNPHDAERVAGGSSGGSAVAVATELVDGALGTDTGGSVRIPASYCGIVGLKPTYGLVPTTGVVENSYTLDHVGPMAGTVADCARILEAITGLDERDPATLQAAGREPYSSGGYVDAASSPQELSSVRLGVIDEGLDGEIDDDVADRTEATLDSLEAAGANVEDVDLPEFDEARRVLRLINMVEVAVHWWSRGAPYGRGGLVDPDYQAAFSGRAEALGPHLGEFYKTMVLTGARIITAHGGRPYTRALAEREAIREQFDEALGEFDVLATPTMPEVAPPVAAATEADLGHGFGYNTRPANLTHHPAMSIPNGTVDGLPVGLQLIGSWFDETTLLSVGAAVESELD